jgi:hypothetical protein
LPRKEDLTVRKLLIFAIILMLSGCSTTHYTTWDPISDKEGLATVHVEKTDALGLSTKTERPFLVPHDGCNADGSWKDCGKSTPLPSSSAQAPGIVGQVINSSAAASGAAQAAVATPIIGELLPAGK